MDNYEEVTQVHKAETIKKVCFKKENWKKLKSQFISVMIMPIFDVIAYIFVLNNKKY